MRKQRLEWRVGASSGRTVVLDFGAGSVVCTRLPEIGHGVWMVGVLVLSGVFAEIRTRQLVFIYTSPAILSIWLESGSPEGTQRRMAS